MTRAQRTRHEAPAARRRSEPPEQRQPTRSRRSPVPESGCFEGKDPKTAKQEVKLAKQRYKAASKGEAGRITPGNARKAVGVVRVIGPALAPYAAQAASAARDTYERARARRLGVSVTEVDRFSGRGAALHARIAGDSTALRDLREREQQDRSGTEVTRFVDSAQRRLSELASAVRAAERMPAGRRRSAYRAVRGELGRIEDDLLRRFRVEG
ncbi:hypothetical protein SAMN04487904_106103 [Actinopolyspora lacussalsi subsp. righensis]|uniref:Uncharacterized protein n=1 Tax=Actinopolyspora righensis TaxID=995060 RepID=A0A1I7A7Z8_9ACTN|nr:DUF6474 family protein [Actinopolyspora righensis]SFT71027.1 hypothetical protein SAMN04487904_106103 [Actinopolyspora righensis]